VKLLRKGVPSFSLLALHCISGKARKQKLEISYNHLFTSMFNLANAFIMVELWIINFTIPLKFLYISNIIVAI